MSLQYLYLPGDQGPNSVYYLWANLRVPEGVGPTHGRGTQGPGHPAPICQQAPGKRLHAGSPDDISHPGQASLKEFMETEGEEITFDRRVGSTHPDPGGGSCSRLM